MFTGTVTNFQQLQHVHSNCNIFTTAATCSQQLQRDHYTAATYSQATAPCSQQFDLIFFAVIFYSINLMFTYSICVLIPMAAWLTFRSYYLVIFRWKGSAEKILFYFYEVAWFSNILWWFTNSTSSGGNRVHWFLFTTTPFIPPSPS